MADKRVTKKTSAVARRKKATTKTARAKVAEPALTRPVSRQATRSPAARVAAPASNPVRQLAQRIVDLTINHDDEGSYALYAADVQSLEPGQPATAGIEAIKQKFAGWHAMAPQATWRARSVMVDGNTIAIEWEGDVTFATGKQAVLNEVAIHEVENGKIVRERFYYDRTALQP
jgi:ketosteroid isomerase-like protein